MRRQPHDGPGPMRLTRRRMMEAGALALSAASVERLLTPAQARAQGAAFKVLTPAEAKTLEAVAETLVVGAGANGAAHFVDQQCALPPQQALLGLRIAGVPPPFAGFYRTVLAEIDRQIRAQGGDSAFDTLSPADRHAFIDRMRRGQLPDWHGPPQGLVYAVLRQDAVDVGYGTLAGSERLHVPYMAHIAPMEAW